MPLQSLRSKRRVQAASGPGFPDIANAAAEQAADRREVMPAGGFSCPPQLDVLRQYAHDC
ncbi:hypothetical protein [Bradyrhizobium sp. STM 3557]|uniref:hypothetical protein n=1 Tax=Bradyrhizobium sp. STM 3557 TaxID=578920 RepID=UPI00388F1982